jgi:UDP-N-acetylmuramate--alanine ligase
MSTPNTHHGAKKIDEILCRDEVKKIFFCGIGGINVSSLAHVTLKNGYKVSGSDRQKSDLTEALVEEGAEIFYEHRAENVDGSRAFVYTVAISPDNPEYVRAGELGIPRISRADYLGYVMTKYKNRLGVCGTHGKSTTTAMCASIFEAAQRDPVVMCGAQLSSTGSAYRAGEGDDFIFEACEYMDSFLDFNPTVALILNVELDHVDYFPSIDVMRSSYSKFVSLTGEGGVAVVNGDDSDALLSVKDFGGRIVTFGIDNESADFRAINLTEKNGRFAFDILKHGDFFTHVELRAAGRHNVLNSLGAAASADALGVSAQAIAAGLSEFSGTKRRMEYKGQFNGADIYDDYAHHPTEVRASLGAFRGFGKGRLICFFQSHTYSRTHALLDDFADALRFADLAVIAPIYSAREINESGVSQYTLAERIGKDAIACESFEECISTLRSVAKAGDTVVLMGAGDLPKILKDLEIE